MSAHHVNPKSIMVYLKVETVNGIDPEEVRNRPAFESLTPIFPDKRFNLETDRHTLATRLDRYGDTHRTGATRD